jgi:hypothetical protein
MALFTNIDSQNGQPKYIGVGQIIGLTISGTMSSYVDGASLSISAPSAEGVQAVGTINVTAGEITGVTFSNVGAGYLNTPTITAPVGSGATLLPTIAANAYKNSEIVFVSYEESQLQANKIKGITTPGWFRVVEKLKSDGQVTFKVECLAALTVMNSVSGDAKADDLVVGDVEISITTQPTSTSVVGPSSVAFVVVGTAITSYQWQIQTAGIGSYTNLISTGVYSGGVTSATLNISNSLGLSSNRYRVVCNNGGTAQVTSRGATLTVTA